MIKINDVFYIKVTPNYFLLLRKKGKNEENVEDIMDDDEDFEEKLSEDYIRCGYYGSLIDLFRKLPDKLMVQAETHCQNILDIKNFIRIYEAYTNQLEATYKTFQVVERVSAGLTQEQSDT